MGSTHSAGVMSIAAEHSGAAELAWQPAGPHALMSVQAQISPLDARQGTGVSSASTTFGLTVLPVSTKRNRSFEDHVGPQVSRGTG